MDVYRWLLLAALLFINSIHPAYSYAQHQVIRSEVDGIPLIRTEGGPKYDGPLFQQDIDLVVGIWEGEPEWQLFHSLHDVIVHPDGRIYLAGSEARRSFEIFIIDPSGQLIKRVGRRGGGPGEFLSIDALCWSTNDNELLVRDQNSVRISRFSLDGEFLRSTNYSDQTGYWRSYYRINEEGYLGKKEINSYNSRSYQYSFLDKDLNWQKDFIEVAARPTLKTSSGVEIPHPFGYYDYVLPFPDGRLLVAFPLEGRLSIYSSSGDLLLHIERDWERPRISNSEKRMIRDRMRRSRAEAVREAEGNLTFPTRRPAFLRPITDDQGCIWVPRYWTMATTGGESIDDVYDIFGKDGVWLGTEVMEYPPSVIQGSFAYIITGVQLMRIRLTSLIPEFQEK